MDLISTFSLFTFTDVKVALGLSFYPRMYNQLFFDKVNPTVNLKKQYLWLDSELKLQGLDQDFSLSECLGQFPRSIATPNKLKNSRCVPLHHYLYFSNAKFVIWTTTRFIYSLLELENYLVFVLRFYLSLRDTTNLMP